MRVGRRIFPLVWFPLLTTAQLPATGLDSSTKVIIFVWDGLRYDSVNEATTPNLQEFRSTGVDFSKHHSTYPTFTMMNAASLATGAYPDETCFFGNTFWVGTGWPTDDQNKAKDKKADGKPVDFHQPVFTEDYAVLRRLYDHYKTTGGQERGTTGKCSGLISVETLFRQAHRKKLTTATVGKSGPAYLQDIVPPEEGQERYSLVLDENLAFPKGFADDLLSDGFEIPHATPLAYDKTVESGSPDPTKIEGVARMADGWTPDPLGDMTPLTRQHSANGYLMRVFLDYILPKKKPDLSVIWLRNPDSAEHDYGPGSPAYYRALASQDALFGRLLLRLHELGLASTTDVLVVSDHGHSTVSGPLDEFPLRMIAASTDGLGRIERTPGRIANPDPESTSGWSVSGEVRIAELLSREVGDAYDGLPCVNNTVLSGITGNAEITHPSGTLAGVCGGKPFVTKDRRLPPTSPETGHAIVVAANGGSDYIYLPDDAARRREIAPKVVSALQAREEVGAIFVNSRDGDLPGTIPLDEIHLQSPRAPDIVFSYSWNDSARVHGVPGTEFASVSFPSWSDTGSSNRGMHGSFSPIDVHNVLMARGPHFRAGYRDPLPSANVDVAATVARIMALDLPRAEGRVLSEALTKHGRPESDYEANTVVRTSKHPAIGLRSTRASGEQEKQEMSYQVELQTTDLTVKEANRSVTYRYFDWARAVRSKTP